MVEDEHRVNRRALIVADDDDVAGVLGLMLGLSGYDSVRATSYGLADKAISSASPAIVLVDIFGEDLFRRGCPELRDALRWRAKHHHIPAVLLFHELSTACLRLATGGFDCVVSKSSLDIDDLLNNIRELLGRRRPVAGGREKSAPNRDPMRESGELLGHR